MDTRTAPVDVTAQIDVIRAQMPETYRYIKTTADRVGNKAYEWVRRGLRGEPNCFWAMEAGRVMGTPFSMPDVQHDVAWGMVSFGCAYACIFPLTEQEATHGAN